MEKRNELKVGVTRCDYCCKPACILMEGAALCDACLAQRESQKTAELRVPLKSCPPEVSKHID